jgi:cleavage stimulation factor subunit 3
VVSLSVSKYNVDHRCDVCGVQVHQVYTRYLDMEDIDPTLAYVQYMKFARRAEGIKSARTVFKRAREDVRSLHFIYLHMLN